MKLALDHIGLLCSDLDNVVAGWRALGFEVSDPVVLDAGAGHDQGQQRSAHIAFSDHYIELSSVSGVAESHPLYRWSQGPDAARILVLACDDAVSERHSLSTRGIDTSPVFDACRAGKQGEARFRWFSLEGDPIPGTLTAWVEHLTPEQVFAPPGHRHPNGVRGFRSLSARPSPVLESLASEDGIPVHVTHASGHPEDAPTLTAAALAGTVSEDWRARLVNRHLAHVSGEQLLEVSETLTGGLRLTLEAPA